MFVLFIYVYTTTYRHYLHVTSRLLLTQSLVLQRFSSSSRSGKLRARKREEEKLIVTLRIEPEEILCWKKEMKF